VSIQSKPTAEQKEISALRDALESAKTRADEAQTRFAKQTGRIRYLEEVNARMRGALTLLQPCRHIIQPQYSVLTVGEIATEGLKSP